MISNLIPQTLAQLKEAFPLLSIDLRLDATAESFTVILDYSYMNMGGSSKISGLPYADYAVCHGIIQEWLDKHRDEFQHIPFDIVDANGQFISVADYERKWGNEPLVKPSIRKKP